jgi:hypothetical protein
VFGLELVDILYAIAAILLAVVAHRLACQMRNGTANNAPANEARSELIPADAYANVK